MDDKERAKVVFLGDGHVGKSCICQKYFLGQTYNENGDINSYTPTIGSDFFTGSFAYAPEKVL
jgi:GTPase SAR1 family protein